MADDSFFVVIEGMDGAGKSSIASELFATLWQTHGDNVALTYEPHDPSAAGLYIRKALAQRIKVSPVSLALAFALNRADHLDHVIEPFLSSGKRRIVISDRYVLSSLAYQSSTKLSMDEIFELNSQARSPDLTIFLNVSPYNCYARIRNRPTDRELFERNLVERVANYKSGIAFLRAKGETIVEVDANPGFQHVFSDVLRTLEAHCPSWLRIQRPLMSVTKDFGEFLLDSVRLTDQIERDSLTSSSEIPVSRVYQIFVNYLCEHGYEWGERLHSSLNYSYELRSKDKIGLEQFGIAFLPTGRNKAEDVSKLIESISNRTRNGHAATQRCDFIIVFDSGGYEPFTRFERDSMAVGEVCPSVKIVTKKSILDWYVGIQDQMVAQP